jgi:hypothetical protein
MLLSKLNADPWLQVLQLSAGMLGIQLWQHHVQ